MRPDRPLRILVLHAMGPRNTWYAGVADVELALPRYAPQHQYLIHDAHIPFPKFARVNFDAVVCTSTFMDLLSSPRGEQRAYKEFGFLADAESVKIALPQDDYWCSEVRDSWYCNLGFDRVYPVCDRKYWPVLVPKFYSGGGSLEQGYTTYVTPRLRNLAREAKPWMSRRHDVVYRAKQTPQFPNRLGYLKGAIGDRFLSSVGDLPVSLDVSVHPSDSIRGVDWWKFVGDSRGIIGSPSGSNLLVRNHEVAACLANAVREGTFDENELGCTSALDHEYEFTAIAPRNLEAAMLGTAQLLVPGDYSGLMHVGTHYIALEPDGSNAQDAVQTLLRAGDEIADECQRRLLTESSLQVERLVEGIFEFFSARTSGNADATMDFEALVERHSEYHKRMNLLNGPASYLRRGTSALRRTVRDIANHSRIEK